MPNHAQSSRRYGEDQRLVGKIGHKIIINNKSSINIYDFSSN